MAWVQDIPNDSWFTTETKTHTLTAITATNITGWALSYQIYDSTDTAVLDPDKTIGSGITVDDATNGIVSVVIDAGDVSTAGNYRYELSRTGTGVETVLATGDVTINTVKPYTP